MKYSAFLAACGAVLAASSPILQERRYVYTTTTVVEWVTVTVTEGDASEPTLFFHRPHNRPKPKTTKLPAPPASTSRVPLPPASSSSSVVIPVPEVPPTTQQLTPTPTPTPTPEPEPEPEPEPAPVIEEPVIEVPQDTSTLVPAPAPSTTKQVSQPTSAEYKETALYHHNVHRFNHSAAALEWDDTLASYAETLAKRCKFGHDVTIGGGGYGQNLAMWAASNNIRNVPPADSIAKAASDGWYNNELKLYPGYGVASPDMSRFSDWGHFSQLVWVETTKLGCATVYCEAGTISSMPSWNTVCNYYPPGNVAGQYAKNVKPPLGHAVVRAN